MIFFKKAFEKNFSEQEKKERRDNERDLPLYLFSSEEGRVVEKDEVISFSLSEEGVALEVLTSDPQEQFLKGTALHSFGNGDFVYIFRHD